MSTPKISVVVPVYNVDKYLPECLDSILSQTFSDFELILVNDFSTDNSKKICDEYAKKDGRIKVIHNAKNKGSSLSRKTGFENSIGEYVQFIDSDDWVEHTILDSLYNAAVKENADLVCCDFVIDYPDKYEYVVNVRDTNNRINNLGFRGYPAAVCYLFRRDLYTKIEHPSYDMAEDRAITQQALFYSDKLCKVPYPLYHYRINSDSMTQNYTEKRHLEYQKNMLWVIDFLKKKLQNDFVMIENDINLYVNEFKYSIIKNKELRKNKSLYKFYPETEFGKYFIKKKLGIPTRI